MPGGSVEPIPVIVTGQEPEWLREQFQSLLREGAPEAEFLVATECPRGAASCVVVTDDLRAPGLRRLLFQCVDRMTGDRLAVLAWDDARRAAALLGIPLVRLYLPLEDQKSALTALEGLTRRGRPPRFAYELDPSLPPSLAVALRLVLNRAGDPLGPPPPRHVSDLAVQVGCSRGTLSRTSADAGVALPVVLSVARARWLVARASLTGLNDPIELARCVGYTSVRSLQRLVRKELRVPLSQISRGSLRRCDTRLQCLLAPVLT
ncbi:MAG: hypothetical protein ACF8LL_06205 [Phycisphaerales bacterium]